MLRPCGRVTTRARAWVRTSTTQAVISLQRLHKYAVKWEPNKQTFYFDEIEVSTLNVAKGDPMYLILGLGAAAPAARRTTLSPGENQFL